MSIKDDTPLFGSYQADPAPEYQLLPQRSRLLNLAVSSFTVATDHLLPLSTGKMMRDANQLHEAPQYDYDKEKDAGIDTADAAAFGDHPGVHRNEDIVKSNPLARTLQGRHMQMIAIGIRASFAESELFFVDVRQVAVSVLVCSSDPVRLCSKVDREAWYVAFSAFSRTNTHY